jgi:ribose transport system ATP-binding protein
VRAHPAGAVLEARGVVKRFPGVLALGGVDLALARGEVLALIGENGAGKSTLMQVLAGIQQPDAGELLLDGRAVVIRSPRAAADLGIALIHQELNVCDNLSAGANVFLGREPRRMGFVDGATLRARAAELLGTIGAGFGPDAPLTELSVGQQQLVEIAKALSIDARVLIMDEPTSSLSAQETSELFRVVRELRARGVGVIYISHRLGEVTALADRALVLRDGRNAGELARAELSHDAMVRLMVGRAVTVAHRVTARVDGAPLLEVRGLRTASHPAHAIDLTVRPGERVGIAGLVGAGRTELLRALFGIDAPLAGEVRVAGVPVTGGPPGALAAGLGLVPEDRKRHGLFLDWPVAENLSIASLDKHARAGFVARAAERRATDEGTRRLGVKTAEGRAVGLLSGGNQQKVVLGRWLARDPRVLLLDEPTRGVDVGARQELYRLLEELAESGVALLFASSEMEEVLALADRVLVMHEGRLAGELTRAELSEEAIMALATGAAGVPA